MRKSNSRKIRCFLLQKPRTPIVLNVTAETPKEPEDIHAVMARQLCSPVRWYDSMGHMRDAGVALFVEVGPGKVLAGIQRKILPKDHPAQICNVGSLTQLEEFLRRTAQR